MIKQKPQSLYTVFFLSAIALLVACNSSKKMTQDYLYFQKDLDSMAVFQFKEPTIQPNDLLSIQVYSKSLNQDQAALFNIPNTGTQAVNGYVVNMDGSIELPFVGNIRAAGLTRTQLSNLLGQKLTPYVKDPSVIVRFLQFRVNVMGEVRVPGSYNFPTDKVTIIDALSAAGDLTEYARRYDIVVIREENGIRKYYPIDLRNGSVFNSPVYQLQQNDIVYVGATTNKMVAINARNKQTIQISGIFISILAVAISVLNTFKK
jgi:polysaccharide export outer membrane protein